MYPVAADEPLFKKGYVGLTEQEKDLGIGITKKQSVLNAKQQLESK